MAFRGRGGRGAGGFRGGRGGFRGGRGGFDRNRGYDQGPPETVTLLGQYGWTVENDVIVKSAIEDYVPYFNAPIYTETKQQLGKIDEIFGTFRGYHVSIKLSENVKASSFEKDTKVYIDPAKLLLSAKFLNSEGKRGGRVTKRGAGRGAGRGGGGGGGRGRGRGGRGGSRGSFNRGGGNRGSGGFRNREGGGGFNRNSGGGYGGGRGKW
ncbi:hypothetical protein DMN91_007172 [Ooceraea biroi]|uniref:H/ACA ribonucleoprotein complex subunit n=2 Tax=Ooceraea biroi TaxID=2015173 RepID=A0A026W8I6_OOCBI|nr:probable H/ACA ribonucleoprotein complex subunit 1 isoform X2 [Ooceraea biroi]EZA52283.1 H/ACA ribonucleoprotein complex subunit [Ooceraea biroi]RLU20561.1 hypothetical protein DMN91_007172 [Ooceraea biroi]